MFYAISMFEVAHGHRENVAKNWVRWPNLWRKKTFCDHSCLRKSHSDRVHQESFNVLSFGRVQVTYSRVRVHHFFCWNEIMWTR